MPVDCLKKKKISLVQSNMFLGFHCSYEDGFFFLGGDKTKKLKMYHLSFYLVKLRYFCLLKGGGGRKSNRKKHRLLLSDVN